MPNLPRVLFITIMLGFFIPSAGTAPKPGKVNRKQIKPARRAKVPKGFVQMDVTGVMEAQGGGFVVILKEDQEGYRLPIYIGYAEAHAIELRLNRRRFQRPLTHDLLDKVMRELGGALVKIHIDDIKDNTFLGTIFVRKKNRAVISIDARPSDSIALALGSKAPIFVSKKVLLRAGIKEDDLNSSDQEPDPEKSLKDIIESKQEEHTL